MNLSEFISKRNPGTVEVKTKIVNGSMPFAMKIGFIAAPIAAGLLIGQVMASSGQDKNMLSEFSANQVIAENTVPSLSGVSNVSLGDEITIEAIESKFGGDNQSASSRSKFDCQVKLDKSANFDYATNSGLSKESAFAFTFVHEQAHCLDGSSTLDRFSSYTMETRERLDHDKKVLSEESFADALAYLTMAAKSPESSEKIYEAIRNLRSQSEADHKTVEALDLAHYVWVSRGDQITHISSISKEETETIVSTMASMISANITSKLANDYQPSVDVDADSIINVFDESYRAGLFFSERQPLGVEKRSVDSKNSGFEYEIKNRAFETKFFVNPDALDKLKPNKDIKLSLTKSMKG